MSWFIFIAGRDSNALNGHNFRPSATAANIKQRDFVFRIVLSLFTHLVDITRFSARDRNEIEEFHENFFREISDFSSTWEKSRAKEILSLNFYAIIVARSSM